jgi:plastocyanin
MFESDLLESQTTHGRPWSLRAALRPLGHKVARVALLAAALVAASPVPSVSGADLPSAAAPTGFASSAVPQEGWEVQVGGADSSGAVAHAFFPGTLTVRAGNSVMWRFAGVHTVTFPGGQVLPPATSPGPASGEETLGPLFFSVGPTGPAASYAGAGIASSGLPMGAPPEEFGYRLTFPEPGVYSYLCALHDGMQGEILVLPSEAGLPETLAEAVMRGRQALAALLDRSRTLIEGVQPIPSADDLPAPVHTVVAGWGDASGAAVPRFLPAQRIVRRGEVVAWSVADPAAPHTVTFTSGATPPDRVRVDLRPQPVAGPALVIPARVLLPAGGATYLGEGYVHSGRLHGGAVYALRFDAPPGTCAYLCLFDPDMRGTITVVEPR